MAVRRCVFFRVYVWNGVVVYRVWMVWSMINQLHAGCVPAQRDGQRMRNFLVNSRNTRWFVFCFCRRRMIQLEIFAFGLRSHDWDAKKRTQRNGGWDREKVRDRRRNRPLCAFRVYVKMFQNNQISLTGSCFKKKYVALECVVEWWKLCLLWRENKLGVGFGQENVPTSKIPFTWTNFSNVRFVCTLFCVCLKNAKREWGRGGERVEYEINSDIHI